MERCFLDAFDCDVEPLAIAHGVQRANAPGDHVLVIGAGPMAWQLLNLHRLPVAPSVMDEQHRLLFCKEQMNVAHTVMRFQV